MDVTVHRLASVFSTLLSSSITRPWGVRICKIVLVVEVYI